MASLEPVLAESSDAIPWMSYQLQVVRSWLLLDQGESATASELFQQTFDKARGEMVRELAPIRGLAAWGLAELAARRGDAEDATFWLGQARTSFDLTLPVDHVYRHELARLEDRLDETARGQTGRPAT